MEENPITNGTRMDYETPTLKAFEDVEPRVIALLLLIAAAVVGVVVATVNLNTAVNVNAVSTVTVAR